MLACLENCGLAEKLGTENLFLEQPVRQTSTVLAIRHAYEHVTELCPTCPRRLGPPLDARDVLRDLTAPQHQVGGVDRFARAGDGEDVAGIEQLRRRRDDGLPARMIASTVAPVRPRRFRSARLLPTPGLSRSSWIATGSPRPLSMPCTPVSDGGRRRFVAVGRA